MTFPGQAVQVRKVTRRMAQVKLPKIGWCIRLSRPISGTVRNATVSRDGLGWHVSFGVHIPEPATPPVTSGAPVGVDVGIACSVFVSDEDGARQRPDTLTAAEKKRLTGLQRRKARRITVAKKHNGGKYSNRCRKTNAAIAALNAWRARRRADFNHKLTIDLAKNHVLIAVEDLQVRTMLRSAKGTIEKPGTKVKQKAGLNRSIADQGWFEIRRQLGDKTRRYGGVLVAVAAAGTSQTCNHAVCVTRSRGRAPAGCSRVCGLWDYGARRPATPP